MGTGIVSIGLLLDGEATLSLILLALDAAIWIGLVVLLPARAIRDLERFRADVRTPAALTSIAGTGRARDPTDPARLDVGGRRAARDSRW